MRREKWTLKTYKGEPICTLIVETEPVPEEKAEAPNKPTSPPGEKMTEPQRRYLFRLLAAQGVEGQAAEEHLKDYFKVRRVGDVPKESASQLIDQMVKDQKEAGDGRP